MHGGTSPAASVQVRLDALGVIVRSKKPEFIALQNVTRDTIKRIKSSTWATRYDLIQPPCTFETRNKPTIALLSTYPAEDKVVIEYHEAATPQLGLLKGYYVMNDKQKKPFVICVATTSLDVGLKYSTLREKQLNEACICMIKAEECFLMGGFGLDNDLDGALTLNGGWRDAWLEIDGNTDSGGYTYDPSKNPLIKDDAFGPGRPDRLFYKTRQYRLDSMELAGNTHTATSKPGAPETVSTHYGLLTQFSSLDIMKPRVEPSLEPVIFNRTEWSVQFQESSNPEKASREIDGADNHQWSVQFQESNNPEKTSEEIDGADDQHSMQLQGITKSEKKSGENVPGKKKSVQFLESD